MKNRLQRLINIHTSATQNIIFSSFCCLLIIFCSNLQAFSSPENNAFLHRDLITIQGKIIDNNGKPLVGVTVKVKNVEKGTITDENGEFSLEVQNDATLEVSYIGYQKKEISVAGRTYIVITLRASSSELNQLVVVGYGTQKKKDLTGAVSTLNFDKQHVVNMPNTASMLEGRMSGVTVISGGAQPGLDNPVIRIRGIGTLGDNDPMIIIDGIEGTVSQLAEIAPGDIENITVLKDAASAAIYGVRAANGVILVTTKRGTNHAPQVNYRGTISLQQATVLPNVVNSWDWAELYNESQNLKIYTPQMIQNMKDGSEPDLFTNTNWYKKVFRTAPLQTHYLSINGGSEKTKYMVSLEYLKQQGIMIGTNSNRINLRSNEDFKINNHISIGLNLAGYRQRINQPFGGTGDGNGIMRTFFWFSRPTVPVKYSDGQWGSVDGNSQMVQIHNPVEWAQLDDNHESVYGFNGQVFATITFLKNFQFKTIMAGKYDQGLQSIFTPQITYYDSKGNVTLQDPFNSLANANNYHYGYESENTLTYSAKYGKNNIAALLGYSAQYDRYDQNSASIEATPNNSIQQLSAGTIFPSVTGTATEVALQSIFGRINYNYDDKYLFEFNLRRDGSSRMPASSRFGVFPSMSAGWIISNEKFMNDINFISNLKIRGSWGKLGNQEIGNYAYDQLVSVGTNYVVGGNQLLAGAAITSLANANIKWESTAITDFGIDLGLFNEKIEVTADYFNKVTSGILLQLPIPLTLGDVGAPYQNAGKVGNKGWELSIKYNNHFTHGNYSLSANISHVTNKVLDLRGQTIYSGYGIDKVGYPIGAYYGYEAIGIYQDSAQIQKGPKRFNGIAGPGDIIYKDISGSNSKPDGQVNADDETIIGNPFPKFTYGFSGYVSYKNFDLSLFFQGIAGIKRFNFEPIGGNGYFTKEWLGRWTSTNPSKTMPRLGGIDNQLPSTFWLANASYLRLKNFELGYSLPEKPFQRLGISEVKLYLSGTNLLTFSKVKNWDPEKFATDANNFDYPETKTYSFNINLTF